MNNDLDIIWVIQEDTKSLFPDYIRSVKEGSVAYYYALYSSAIRIENAFNFVKRPIVKKYGQISIQTMHGSLGIKRIDKASGRKIGRNLKGAYSAYLTDFIISNSEFENMVYNTSFWGKTNKLEFGHARVDILIESEANKQIICDIKKRICDFYKIDINCRIAMYGPTLVSNDIEEEKYIDFDLLKRVLKDRFGGEWKIISRMHPADARNGRGIKNTSSDVLDGNLWDDMQELIAITDFAITDYSSWIYDYVMTRRPGLIYAMNLEKYENYTGFYYPIKSVPFPIAEENDEMVQKITTFNESYFKKKVEEFIDEKKCFDDGKASERIANFIFEKCMQV